LHERAVDGARVRLARELKIKHVPEQLIDVTLTPVLLVFLLTYMFGGAIASSTGDYLQFLLAGMSLLFSTVY
jgi:ABC-2 type transport system permease protein